VRVCHHRICGSLVSGVLPDSVWEVLLVLCVAKGCVDVKSGLCAAKGCVGVASGVCCQRVCGFKISFVRCLGVCGTVASGVCVAKGCWMCNQCCALFMSVWNCC